MKSLPFHITYKGKALLPTLEQSESNCYFYEITQKKKPQMGIHHHILLVHLEAQSIEVQEQLKHDLKKVIYALSRHGKRYVSVLAYKKQEGVVQVLSSVKCDKASYKMSEMTKVIDEAVEMGCHGPISQALKSALELTKRLGRYCEGQHITLLTDGLGGINNIEEQERCKQFAKQCKEEGISLNAVGRGVYYDDEFLKSLVHGGSGNEVLHIEETETYERIMRTLVQNIENISRSRMSIGNKMAFLCDAHHYFTEGNIEGLSEEYTNILVTYDEPLQLLVSKVRIKKEEDLSEVLPYYLYQWGAYLIKVGEIERAEEVIAKTGDIGTYKKVYSAYTMREKGQLYKTLIQLAKVPNKRYKEGKVEIDLQSFKREEPLCLLEVLALIMSDEESELFWDYNYPYRRIGPMYKNEEQDYIFIKPRLGYGEIERIHIGNKKLNIGVQVKVAGQVEECKTHLKLDASVYREYNLLVNGNLNTQYLIARLSHKVRAKLRKQGVIHSVVRQGQEVFYKLKLDKLKVVNNRVIEQATSDQVANMLYELEVVKLREGLIRKYLKNHVKEIKIVRSRQSKLYERFNMNEHGIFEAKKTVLEETSTISTYTAKVVEWKVEKFPRKKLEEEVNQAYHLEDLKPTSRQIKQLEDLQGTLKQQRRELEDRLQLIRIGSVLLNKPIFEWETTVTKPKKQTIPCIEGNAVIGDCMHVSSMKVEEWGVKEESYTILVASSN